MLTAYISKLKKKHTVQKQQQTSSDMSSNTNQSSASPNQQHMAHLEHMLGATTTQSTKQAKKSFIGANTTDKQSEEVTGGGKVTTHLKLEQRT